MLPKATLTPRVPNWLDIAIDVDSRTRIYERFVVLLLASVLGVAHEERDHQTGAVSFTINGVKKNTAEWLQQVMEVDCCNLDLWGDRRSPTDEGELYREQTHRRIIESLCGIYEVEHITMIGQDELFDAIYDVFDRGTCTFVGDAAYPNRKELAQ